VSLKAARNIVIVLAIAAVVDIVPGGGTGANVVIQAISLTFLGALTWVVSLMYREHRNALHSLGDRRRATLYVAAGVLAVTLTATNRMWSSPLGSVAWLVLIAGSVYAAVQVLASARRY
jgi:membrane-bound metal-dependent hydrolase YbcI (DUF457 family)